MREDFDPGWIAHRIAIERPVETPDGAGGSTIAWEELATVWASIEPLVAHESANFDRLATRITHRITIRHRTDVAGGMRIRHRGRLLRIASLRDPDERWRFLVIDAEEEERA